MVQRQVVPEKSGWDKLAEAGGSFLGRAGRAGLTALTGIPFETSGGTAVASPNSIGPLQVSAPASNGYIRTTGNPVIRSTKNGDNFICHREYIMDIAPDTQTVSDVFQLIVAESINPGNSQLFPWLSAIAMRYETYIFRGLRFIYEPQCSTTSPGTVAIVVDYDALDAPPQNKLQMMSYKGAVRSPPWFCSNFTAASSDLQKAKEYYVTNTSQVAGGDARLYNVGNLFLAYEGPAGTTFAAGELYVEYMIELRTPNMDPFANSGSATLTGANIQPSGNIGTLTQLGPLKISLSGLSDSLFIGVSVPGTYLITLFGTRAVTTGNSNFQFQNDPGSVGTWAEGNAPQTGNAVSAATVTSLCAYSVGYFSKPTDVLKFTAAGTFAAQQFTTIVVNALPVSQSTFNFPVTATVNGLPLAFMSAMARCSLAEQKLIASASSSSDHAELTSARFPARDKPIPSGLVRGKQIMLN
jgi:hypothetical protein